MKHHPAVPVANAPDAFARLWQDRESGQGVRAVLLVALTGLRSGEVRNLRWDDVDGDVITIPPERMKARREHRLPMVDLLADWPRWANSPLILPNSRGQALSGVTLTRAMRKVGLGAYSVHGWRSTFSEWAHENGANHRHVEDALARTIGSDVERAYRRSDYLEARRPLMEEWAKYLFSNINGI